MSIIKSNSFLRARWEYLVMINYEVDAKVLQPYVPAYTEIDQFDGKVLMSVVGFLFNDTRVLGIRWPLHTNFEEVNLRFYIRHFDGRAWKRGVTFVSEIVPSPIIATIANTLYNERYSSASMRHRVSVDAGKLDVSYTWKQRRGGWNSIQVSASANSTDIQPGSAEEFIFEHYFGYNQQKDLTTISYAVEHPRWQVFPVNEFSLHCDVEGLYGKQFVPYINGVQPHSVMLARGSEVLVKKPVYIRRQPLPE